MSNIAKVFGVLIGALLMILAVGSCFGGNKQDARSSAASSSSARSSSATDKYTQTWSKSYSRTSCDDWATAMTERQQWAAAADMLTSARNKQDGGTGLPPDDLVTLFGSDISEACSADVKGLMLTDAAIGVYLIGRDTYSP